MHPEIRQARPVASLCLSDLIGMVHIDVVLAASVNVEVRPQVLSRHG